MFYVLIASGANEVFPFAILKMIHGQSALIVSTHFAHDRDPKPIVCVQSVATRFQLAHV